MSIYSKAVEILHKRHPLTGRKRKEPNLQNIPISTPEGKKIREAFQETWPLSADYSGVELHILQSMHDVHIAHCCKIHGCKYGDGDCTVENTSHPGVTGDCQVCFDSSLWDEWGMDQ